MTPEELRSRLDTLVVVFMENRSFDHVLGHLRLPRFGGRTDVDGIDDLQNPAFGNPSANGTMINPFIMKDGPLPSDLPHDRDPVAIQLATSPASGGPVMNGFVKAYEQSTGSSGVLQPPPMGILGPDDLPMMSFFAKEYTICDNWFAPIPTSTHPNRLMAMSGYTLIDETHNSLVPDQEMVFDWLEARGIRWRVYSAGLSFFLLMRRLWPRILTDHFRGLSHLSYDFQHEADSVWPQVVFIEPDYGDSPVHLSGHACDNHPPLPIGFGEAFLRQVYEVLGTNPTRWQKTAMVVSHDEHGGFFDHVRPLGVPSPVPANAQYTKAFTTTGVRVPSVVVSPMVGARKVSTAPLDHTSILQLIAERFGGPGENYSPEVDARRQAGIASLSAVLDASTTRIGPPPPAPGEPILTMASLQTNHDPQTNNQAAFVAAVEQFARAHGGEALSKFPQIAHWMGTP